MQNIVTKYYVSMGAGAWQTDGTKKNIEYNNETTNDDNEHDRLFLTK